jgi:hypothetical protein
MDEPVESDAFIPLWARVHLSHAAVETLARDASVDLLHIKGPAVLPGLRERSLGSNDVDVIVRPSHLGRFEAALAREGWDRRSDLESGSAFHHAANWYHPSWGYVDVHARWPGPRVDPEQVYAEFAAGDHVQEIAHVACRVPNRVAQILILVLHAGRTPGRADDVATAWHAVTPDDRAAVRDMAARLRAETGLAAGLGRLDSVRGDPEADLWRVLSLGGSRVDEWRARLRAAPDRCAALKVLLSSLRVNRDYLRMELGRQPTRADVRRRQWRRVQALAHDLAAAARHRIGRRP